ncbi:hypothetical protein OF83DRAFT_1219600 [Amylostereum chailletii]|nr:hypothetical protein OF83DRAFT_1219600 [Amylostereum chailletii]
MQPEFWAVAAALATLPLASGQTWCGKVYMANETVVPPGGAFPVPASSPSPLLALRCNPALIPFLPDDVSSGASILVDALVRYSHIVGAQDVTIPDGDTSTLHVTASIDGNVLGRVDVGLNGTAALSFDLSSLEPRTAAYTLTCEGTLGDQTFQSSSNLTFLPTPPDNIGSVTKRDLRTGGLLAKAVGSAGDYEPVLPVGFYTSWGGYLEGNNTVVEVLHDQGFNMIHPVPTYDNQTALNEFLEQMEKLNMWLMYDMRWTYMNDTSVTTEVSPLRPLKNLLLYYTADEPDGTSDPLNATTHAYDLIRALDPYRPTSLVLNCQDYFFSEYAAGADVLLQDVYEVGNNVTFSTEWGTPCTRIQGDCGCDNCAGRFEDIRDRVTDFKERMEVLGWERTKSVWTVPQGFGGAEFVRVLSPRRYWSRAPTGEEWLVEAIVGINAGALGVVSWNDPTTADIKAASSKLAQAVPALTPFILSPASTFQHVITADRLDLGVWSNGREHLVLASNLNYENRSVSLQDVFGDAKVGEARVVLDAGASVGDGVIRFGSVQSGAWVFAAGNKAGSSSSSSAASIAAPANSLASPRVEL